MTRSHERLGESQLYTLAWCWMIFLHGMWSLTYILYGSDWENWLMCGKCSRSHDLPLGRLTSTVYSSPLDLFLITHIKQYTCWLWACLCLGKPYSLCYIHISLKFSSVQFNCSVMPDSATPGLQQVKFPCPSSSSGACSNSCPSSRWCHSTILSSVIPFSCLQSFPASVSFPVSQFLAWGGQSIGASASTSVLPVNIQDLFPLGLTSWISLQSKGLSRVYSNTTVQKHQHFGAQICLWSNSHIHTWLLEKTIPLTRWTFVSKVMSLLFNMLPRLVIAFLPRSKHLLISLLQSSSAVILESPKIKSLSLFPLSPPSISHEVRGTGCHDPHFLNVEF